MNKKPLKKSIIIKLLKKIGHINLEKETIILEKSIGRFLSQDLISKVNLPPFNNSAVDGYALMKHDILKKNINFTCNQRIAAGDIFPKKIKKTEVARVFTGAPMPANSKTVVMQENVIKKNNKIIIKKIPRYGENCRLAGEDISIGKKIFLNGDKINSTNINLIAAIGKTKIIVKKKIKIGFFTSGNELIKPTERLKGSSINNSNYYSLFALLNQPYIKSKYLGLMKDKEPSIKKLLLKNVDNYNVIITTGGASVGEEDYLVKSVSKLGEVFFWKTAIKPGRPLSIGKINNTIIICLPGNPVSVHLLYGMIIKPFIKYLCNRRLVFPRGILAKVDFNMQKKNQRLEWLRVKIKYHNQTLYVSKFSKQGSGMISSMAFADGIIEIPEEISDIKKNDSFYFYSFENLYG